jgi:deoxyadenosine/deoxycytidine kinase
MHIAVAGNIGSGKTTLTGLLSKQFGWKPHYEDVDENPYLDDFYNDMQRWSFNLQVYFLNTRFNHILNIKKSNESIIQDRTIYEDAYIFAPNLHSMGLMSTRDFENYFTIFNLVSSLIQPPDLVIYLHASVPTLVRQIEKRGRKYEDNIRIDYLKKLNERYDSWAEAYNFGKKLIIDVDHLNFIDKPEDLSTVIDKINAEFHGLFPSK